MAKPTPGPWQAGRPDMSTIVDGIASKWIYAGDQYVAIASGRIQGVWDEVMANARLIAAAPDMYEALEELLGPYDLTESGARKRYDAAIEKARAALAKARGEDHA